MNFLENFIYYHNIGYYNPHKGYLKMNILTFLKNNQNTRKIFGKRELKIIEKQLLGINLSQSEKNRLSRDIRKKFEFIQEISHYTFDLKLKKGTERKQMIESVKKVILNHRLARRIKKIYLFGSSVKNEVTFRSDIDIAVEFGRINLTEATKFRINISGEVSDMFDIQVFNVLPKKIKDSINKNHKVIYNGK